MIGGLNRLKDLNTSVAKFYKVLYELWQICLLYQIFVFCIQAYIFHFIYISIFIKLLAVLPQNVQINEQ